MSPTSADRLPIVEEVVATLTAAPGKGSGGAEALRAGMRRATDQFDEHAAAALARALVDVLCKAPDDVRVLETLVILGLAHPKALVEHRISLATEGRRLAALLQKSGESERAECLGQLLSERVPGVAKAPTEKQEGVAVEQLVRDAEFAAAKGRTEAAIRCLEEAQRLAPERTDLQRAVLELRRQVDYRKKNARRALRLCIVVVALSCVGTAFFLRESRIWSAWQALPPASYDDLPAMRARLAGIEALIERERFWTTMPKALLERDVLSHDIALKEKPVLPILTDVLEPGTPPPGTGPLLEAEEARKNGLKYAQSGLPDEALVELRRALALAPPDWAHREKVLANVEALEAFKRKNP